ncbi:hypothetical protein ACL2XO_13140 [Sodalis sp. RH15]|uniref:hypothetical protein n=1 Tax=Sodalis sp. RH15 TaxID=3394330 RepID=UPI0039B6C197
MNTYPISIHGPTVDRSTGSLESNWPGGGASLPSLLSVSNTPLDVLASKERHTDQGLVSIPSAKSVLSSLAIGRKNVTVKQQNCPVVTYGICDEIRVLDKISKDLLKINWSTAVCQYNEAIGLHYELSDQNCTDYSSEAFFNLFLNNLMKIEEYGTNSAIIGLPSLADIPLADRSTFVDSYELNLWKKYLFEHKEKLDPVLRLKRLMTMNATIEREVILNQFIVKNTMANIDNEKLACVFMDFIDRFNCTTHLEIKHALNDYKKLNGVSFFSESDYVGLAELFGNHFARNTSKLGLGFFALRGFDINFSWNVNKDTLVDLNVIQDKPWKRGERRFDGGQEWITASEIRCVLRNTSGIFNGKVFKTGIFKDAIIISNSLTSNAWQGFFYYDSVIK